MQCDTSWSKFSLVTCLDLYHHTALHDSLQKIAELDLQWPNELSGMLLVEWADSQFKDAIADDNAADTVRLLPQSKRVRFVFYYKRNNLQ